MESNISTASSTRPLTLLLRASNSADCFHALMAILSAKLISMGSKGFYIHFCVSKEKIYCISDKKGSFSGVHDRIQSGVHEIFP